MSARSGRWARIGVICAFLAPVAACGQAPTPVDGVNLVPHVSENSIGSSAWMSDGTLYYLDWDKEDAPAQLFAVRPGQRPTKVQLSIYSGCKGAPSLANLQRVPDGRLGAVDRCGAGPAKVVVVDSGGGLSILTDRLPGDDVVWGGSPESSWVPLIGGHGCMSLVRADGRKLPFGPGHVITWAASDLHAGTSYAECASFGRASFPVVGRDGTGYFLASPPGPLSSPWAVFKVGRDGSVSTVGGQFTDVRGAALRESRSEVIVSASRDGKEGLWALNMSTGSIALHKEGRYDALALDEKETTLAANWYPGPFPGNAGIRRLVTISLR